MRCIETAAQQRGRPDRPVALGCGAVGQPRAVRVAAVAGRRGALCRAAVPVGEGGAVVRAPIGGRRGGGDGIGVHLYRITQVCELNNRGSDPNLNPTLPPHVVNPPPPRAVDPPLVCLNLAPLGSGLFGVSCSPLDAKYRRGVVASPVWPNLEPWKWPPGLFG